MKKYDILLADADNTLLDFTKSERVAASALFSEFGTEPDDKLLNDYSEYNDSLWKRLERGELSMKELISLRFTGFFKDHGIKGDGDAAAIRYRQILSKCAFKIEGADELLHKCRGRVKVYIISNGKAEVQLSRLRLSGITDITDGIFLSEIIGAQKPDTYFFTKAASSIEGFSKERTLIYGDSLTADIAGGVNSGIDTCWYNPGGIVNRTPFIPDYEIKKHSDLYSILKI